ncbi:hypothetical protein [Streptomyces sp. NPDC002676]
MKRVAALAIASAAFVGANLTFTSPANADVIVAPCPTNGVNFWIYHGSYDSDDYCFAGNPSGGYKYITPIYNIDAVGSNWNNGWVYYQDSLARNHTLYYYANGVNYSTGDPHSRGIQLYIAG